MVGHSSPYCGPAPNPGDWLGRWNLDPVLLALMLGLLAWWWLRRREAAARDPMIPVAIGIFAVLFISPFCSLGSALFSARAVHHVILAAVLAPAIALAIRRPIAVPLALSILVHGVTFWAWHLPPLYEAALSNDAMFWLMQGTIGGTAVLSWISIFRAPAMLAVAGLLANMIHMGALGALLTFTGRPLYVPHSATTAAWGLSPIEDQQLAGLIMWAPGSLIYLLAAVAILYRSMQARLSA